MSEVLTITDDARDKILEVLLGEDGPEELALFVEIAGQQDGAYTYTMDLRPVDEAGTDDLVQHHGGVRRSSSARRAPRAPRRGNARLHGCGMVMQNPNRPEAAAVAPL